MCERTAVCKIESGPEVNSCSSRTEISYSLHNDQHSFNINQGMARVAERRGTESWTWQGAKRTYVSSIRGLFSKSL